MDTQAFENMPVTKAVLVNAVPAVLSMLVTLVYNVADTFFIGQTGDEMQVVAVSLATPRISVFHGHRNTLRHGRNVRHLPCLR